MDKYTFDDLRILATAAYDFLMGNPSKDCASFVGGLFYPTLLDNDRRRLGGLIALSIRSLDDHFKGRVLLGGPAFTDETRRLLVADVVASAHLQARDLGWLDKIIKAWYPDNPAPLSRAAAERISSIASGWTKVHEPDTLTLKQEMAEIVSLCASGKPEADPAWKSLTEAAAEALASFPKAQEPEPMSKVTPDRYKAPKATAAKPTVRDVIGMRAVEDMGNAFYDLKLAIEGVINLFDIHDESNAAFSLQRIFRSFQDQFVPTILMSKAPEGEG